MEERRLRETHATLAAIERQAHRHLRKRQFEQAAKLAQRALALAPGRAYAHYIVGEAAWQLGRVEEARESFCRAMSSGEVGCRTIFDAGKASYARRDVGRARLFLGLIVGAHGAAGELRGEANAMLMRLRASVV